MLALSQKVPFLSDWISPLPSLNDVSPSEYAELTQASRTSPDKAGPRFSIALSKNDELAPAFYVASNLPDGAQFQIVVIGVPESLLNQTSFSSQAQATLTQKLSKTGPIRYSDGKPIPRGQYFVYLLPTDNEPQTAKSLIQAYQPPNNTRIPPELPNTAKVLLSKSYFLGGPRDSNYLVRLKEFHDKLREKATSELTEIKQFTDTLDSQLASTVTKFTMIKKGKITARQRKSWEDFHNQWMKFQGQLDQNFQRWTPEAIQNEYFYGVLYQLTQQAGQMIDKVHGFQHAFFTGSQDPRTSEIQLGEATSSAQSSLNVLKSKIGQAEKLPPTPNGMPRREGL